MPRGTRRQGTGRNPPARTANITLIERDHQLAELSTGFIKAASSNASQTRFLD
tara:strand:- start:200 stop:358 length:159 start_codon:yes stop_codon:yes gene_type:complete